MCLYSYCWSINHCTIYTAANSAELTSYLILQSWTLIRVCSGWRSNTYDVLGVLPFFFVFVLNLSLSLRCAVCCKTRSTTGCTGGHVTPGEFWHIQKTRTYICILNIMSPPFFLSWTEVYLLALPCAQKKTAFIYLMILYYETLLLSLCICSRYHVLQHMEHNCLHYARHRKGNTFII